MARSNPGLPRRQSGNALAGVELVKIIDDPDGRAQDVYIPLTEVVALVGALNGDALGDHLNDVTDAHDASAVSVLDTGNYFAGNDVETVLADLGANTVRSTTVRNIVQLTQAAYDALGTPVATTLYVIIG